MTQDLFRFAVGAAHHSSLRLRSMGMLFGLFVVAACQAEERPAPSPLAAATTDVGAASSRTTASRLWMTIGERRFAITLADTDAASAFAARLPMTLDMTELNGNEKKFDLPTPLPANASRPGAIRNGDLMLYGSNTVVLFYLTFDSLYAYTRLGRVDDPAGLAQTLGPRNARVAFSKN
ncbi:cyclophilin-like fold protein [Variovorax sp. HJSM1_2]|uniref:cyclophilin-like fold protein n=1 Tax=Variovorax sp. HJSM1_2 TaxID=3366263 RepID=UPI003BCC2606